MEANQLFPYVWAFLRAAERSTRQRPSKAGGVLLSLSRLPFAQRAPEHTQPEKNRNKTGAFGAGVWVGRDVLKEAHLEAYGCDTEEKADRLAGNFLGREKSPVGPLTDFVRTEQFDELLAGRRSIDSFLKPSDRDFLRDEFGAEAHEIAYQGVPIIGSGLPRMAVWFGVTEHRWLWSRANEERAAALAFPIQPLPELLVSWSPLGGWRPPSGVVSHAAPEYQLIALTSYAFASGVELHERKVGRQHIPYMHGSFGQGSGYVMALGIHDWKQPDDVGALTKVLDALRTSGEMRPDILLLCTGLEDHVVASEVHRYHATSSHPLYVFHTSLAELHATVRHLPWLWYERGQAGGDVLSSREVDVGSIIRLACFLDYWRLIAPETARKVLERCWRDVLRTQDFEALADALVAASFLPQKWSTADDLLLPSFIRSVPTQSPGGEFIREVEDWMLAHHNVFGDPSRDALTRIGRFNERAAVDWNVEQKLDRALVAHRRAADGEDPRSLIDVATLTLRTDSVPRGLVLLEQLLERFPERAAALRRTVLDIAEGALTQGDFERFASIVSWPEVTNTDYVRPFVSQMVGLRKDPAGAEAVVRHLLRVGLVKQVVHEVDSRVLCRSHEFLRDLVPKLRSESTDEVTRSGLEVLSNVIHAAREAQRVRTDR